MAQLKDLTVAGNAVIGGDLEVLGNIIPDVATKDYVDTKVDTFSTNTYTKAAADSTFVKKTDADNTYLTKVTAETEYLTKANAETEYLKTATAESTYLPKTEAANFTKIALADRKNDAINKSQSDTQTLFY